MWLDIHSRSRAWRSKRSTISQVFIGKIKSIKKAKFFFQNSSVANAMQFQTNVYHYSHSATLNQSMREKCLNRLLCKVKKISPTTHQLKRNHTDSLGFISIGVPHTKLFPVWKELVWFHPLEEFDQWCSYIQFLVKLAQQWHVGKFTFKLVRRRLQLLIN